MVTLYLGRASSLTSLALFCRLSLPLFFPLQSSLSAKANVCQEREEEHVIARRSCFLKEPGSSSYQIAAGDNRPFKVSPENLSSIQ